MTTTVLRGMDIIKREYRGYMLKPKEAIGFSASTIIRLRNGTLLRFAAFLN